MNDSYSRLGASASKQGLHDALARSGLAAEENLFSSVWPDLAGDPNYRCFLHCDGAGTKTILAYLLYRETGDTRHFAGLAQDALAMNLDDVFCVGTPESLMLSNLIARNANLVPDSVLETLLTSYRLLQEQLSALGIHFILSGGETADCGDVVRTLVVDAVLAGRISTSALVRTSNIQVGDAIIGISSTGQTKYESVPNSGISSNGLTLARHCMLSKRHVELYPEVVDPSLDSKLCYRGPHFVTDKAAELGGLVGEALLSPTRIYAPILRALFAKLGSEIHSVVHLTGGGQTKPLRFAQGKLLVKNNLFATPPLFSMIQEGGNVPWKEMYQVFNMGHRMEIYVEQKNIPSVINTIETFGIEAKQVGEVRAMPSNSSAKLLLQTSAGEFEYSI